MRQYEPSGVAIGQCSDCRGIFLDRGELERLSDAENAWHRSNPPLYPAGPYQGHPQPGYGYGYHKKRRKSFFEELFD